MYNNLLVVYPRTVSGTKLEITGSLSPPPYNDEDLVKQMVKVPVDAATEVQGLSNKQLKLVRYRVLVRLFEDKHDLKSAQYMEARARRLEHKMHASHEDDEFTSHTGVQRGDTNAV